MVGAFDNVVLFLSWLCQIAVVVCSLKRREFRQYLTLNLYMLVSTLASIAVCVCMWHFGRKSPQYFNAYYIADVLLSLSFYFVIIHLYQQALGNTGAKPYIRNGAPLILALTCMYSYLTASHAGHDLPSRFAVGLEQNLNFVGVALTYFLWGAIMKLRETRTRLVQLILSLGIYFSAFAAAYAVRTLFPQFDEHGIWRWAPPLISLWLPLAWSYAFIAIPDGAQLPTSRVALSHR